MTNNEIFNRITAILNTTPHCSITSCLKRHIPEIYDLLLEHTSFLDKYKNVSILERIYCLEHNLTDRPLCHKCCTQPVCSFDNLKNEYRKWCSPTCQATDKLCLTKSKQTKLDRYGDENFNNVAKSKQTRSSKYNGHFHPDDFSAKVKCTKLSKYGNETFVNTTKSKQTKLERYGDENFNNVAKSKQTKLERYGDENFNNALKISKTKTTFSDIKNISINEKRKNTNVVKYGCEFPTQSDVIKEKTKNTCIQKYNVQSTLQLDNVRNALNHKIREKSWIHIMSDKSYIPCFTKEEYLTNMDRHIWRWKCTKCGDEFDALYDNGQHHRCYKCWPNTKYGTSLMEQQLAEFISTIISDKIYTRMPENRQVLSNNRELDIYIPSKHIAIEFNGLFYHSESAGKDKNYHLSKLDECEQMGIHLIHIFEDDWVYKQNIVKNRLRNLLVTNKRKIFARKCCVELIANDVKNSFMDKYHIQGHDVSKVNLGLKYGNHIVAIMTFVKARFNKNYEWELSRYATVANFSVVGGASKLLKHFERKYHPRSLITYADRCWSTGKLYEKIGFTLNSKTMPGYSYVKNGMRFNRINFQKHKLKNILDIFDENLSEFQNMKNNGYDRIFDCGNLVFVKTY